jgi:hypothetical protein
MKLGHFSQLLWSSKLKGETNNEKEERESN